MARAEEPWVRLRELLDAPAGEHTPAVVAWHGDVAGLSGRFRQSTAAELPDVPCAAWTFAGRDDALENILLSLALGLTAWSAGRASGPWRFRRFEPAFHRWGRLAGGPATGVELPPGLPVEEGAARPGAVRAVGLWRRFVAWLQLRRLDREGLLAALPERLLSDLTAVLPARDERAVRGLVCLEGLDALLRLGDADPLGRRRAAWLREVLVPLCAKARMLVVVIGEDRLTWADDGLPDEELEQHVAGGLSARDARRLLAARGIRDEALAAAMMAAALTTWGSDPLVLGLAADLAEAQRAAGRGEPTAMAFSGLGGDPAPQLIERLLALLPADLVAPLCRLSLPRWFDAPSAAALCGSAQGEEEPAWWKRLSQLAVVEPLPGTPGRHRIASRVTMRLLRRLSEAERAAALLALEEHHAARAETLSDGHEAEAWYAGFLRDPAGAMRDLGERIELDVRQARVPAARGLLRWTERLDFAAEVADPVARADALRWYARALASVPVRRSAEPSGRAIAACEEALGLISETSAPESWAAAQSVLGSLLRALPTGPAAAQRARAIACYEAALRVLTAEDHPEEWGKAHNQLGHALVWSRAVDRTADLQCAIEHYELALQVCSETVFPMEWGHAQNGLGGAYHGLELGDDEHARRAIEYHEAALRVFTEADQPSEWATTLSNLGMCRVILKGEPRAENLRLAIEEYRRALRVCSEDDYPWQWAVLQANLGYALWLSRRARSAGDYDEAIEHSLAALRVYTEADHPYRFASTQFHLAVAYRDRRGGDPEQQHRRAIECCEAALRVFTEADQPLDWGGAQMVLAGIHRRWIATALAEAAPLAVEHYRAALRVLTEANFPALWAAAQRGLGQALRDLPEGDRRANLRAAADALGAALRHGTEEGHPADWAFTSACLGYVLKDLHEQGDFCLDEALARLRDAERGFRAGGKRTDADRVADDIARLDRR